MRVNLEAAPETENGWFDLRDGGRVHLRLLSADDLRAMRKACMTVAVEYPQLGGKYQRFEAQKFDEEEFDRLRWDKCIVGWEKIFDGGDKEIAVTPEHKALLMERVPEFAEAVMKGIAALKDAEQERLEAREKNSRAG